ncbi:hypothetical protein AURDEDRAFT_115475 [Auricularia subglabra TFB-10046 SS5]|uniref:Uncharacterized protein n=1 Tax=Auricularia subglabra (strain TFB-10046 / SS5) TaxID=717982 RepID=J0LK86_AURST|nr:hypothetical protein AURDEDRAFT_115475 [Auricularia subglabra TFB-10046 SS5]
MSTADSASIPTGALVGIALGALAVVLALGLLAVVVRDRHRAQPAGVQVRLEAGPTAAAATPPDRDATVSPFVLPQLPPPATRKSWSRWPAPNIKGAVGY